MVAWNDAGIFNQKDCWRQIQVMTFGSEVGHYRPGMGCTLLLLPPPQVPKTIYATGCLVCWFFGLDLGLVLENVHLVLTLSRSSVSQSWLSLMTVYTYCPPATPAFVILRWR